VAAGIAGLPMQSRFRSRIIVRAYKHGYMSPGAARRVVDAT
jgi:hypothetical protein